MVIYHYLYKINEHIYSSSDDDLLIVLKVFEVIDDEHYDETVPALLYALEKAYDVENGTNEYYENALLKIKYTHINLKERTIDGDAINVIINTNIHSYLKLLINYSIVTNRLRTYVDDVLSFFYTTYSKAIVFRAIISHFYPLLLYFNKKKYSQLFLYLFNGTQSSVCYETLAYSRSISKDILKQLSEIDQFRTYLFDDSKDKMYVKRNYATYYINEYISRDSFESLVKKIISDPRFISSVEDVVRWGSEDLKNNTENTADYNRLFSLCNKSYSSILKTSHEVDQLIRFVSEYIVLSNNNDDDAWSLLVLLSKKMKSYFSEEYMKLIDTFKNNREMYIFQLIDNFVDVYEKFTFNESTVVEIINMLTPINYYHDHLIKWKRKLFQKDPFLNSVLNTRKEI